MKFSHLDSEGAARMVDVGEKEVVRRIAVAGAVVRMSSETIGLLRKAALPKGDVLNTARIACRSPRRPVRATVRASRWRPSPLLAWPR